MSGKDLLLVGAAQSAAANYIEDVFSTYLYTSTGGDVTVTNGIDLSGKGGLVWIKSRSNAFDHNLTDTARGAGRVLYSNLVNGQSGVGGGGASSFSSTGYVDGNQNANGVTQVSWTFREQAKFFDVVTYTGNGTAGRQISHSLGSVPGFVIIKNYSSDRTEAWTCWHRGLTAGNYIVLNTTAAQTTAGATARFGNDSTTIDPTSTVFTVGSNPAVNGNSTSYVAYLFAHNAGGFGLAGTDNVISCGSFTTDGSGNWTASLGFEPQWILHKPSSAAGDWLLVDNMRGWTTAGNAGDAYLYPNTSAAEFVSTVENISPNATGMSGATYNANTTYIYIAIRRGPMKTPTSGTSVFNPVLASTTAPAFRSSNFTSGIDSALVFYKPGYDDGTNAYANWQSRLTGTGQLQTPNTRAEISQSYNLWDYMNGQNNFTGLGTQYGAWLFRRAPGFFDVVCYTGNGSTQAIQHNLGVAPELIITKNRNSADYGWPVFRFSTGNGVLYLNTTAQNAGVGADWWGNNTISINPTSTTITVGSVGPLNQTGYTYVSYLFSSVAGVSKVGSYTGTGTTQTINCGFTAGARFVMIKRTDSTGDWYVWDSARGIVAGNDPYLLLNSTAAEVTGTDYVDTANSGFEISSTAPAAINANGGTFIFLAIA